MIQNENLTMQSDLFQMQRHFQDQFWKCFMTSQNTQQFRA